MCLILIANDAHPRYRLVIAANRDEFYERPTARADWWNDAPGVLAGRDLQSGGTWMGVARSGRFAAVTNFRDPGAMRDDAPSRGGIVLGALTTSSSLDDYLTQVEADGEIYNGFNLLAGDGGGLRVYSNRHEAPARPIGEGVFGISNHLFDTPWPKVVGGREALTGALDFEGDALVNALLSLLDDREIPPDEELPDTGVGIEYERVLGSRFITSEVYGTRASYVVLFDRDGEVTFVEQTFDHGEPVGDPLRFAFQVQFTA
jgi:uncharacterized protein with NRDE domain